MMCVLCISIVSKYHMVVNNTEKKTLSAHTHTHTQGEHIMLAIPLVYITKHLVVLNNKHKMLFTNKVITVIASQF